MFLLFSIVTLFVAPSPGSSASLSRVTALKFAPNSFIQYTPDWSRLTSAISVCVWIKDTGSSPHRTFFSYHSSEELIILADGSHTGIFNLYQHLQSKHSVPKGTWHFVCVTWSLVTRDHKYYVNGVLLGSKQTAAGRSLKTGGELFIGKWYGTSSRHDFAGEMANLNVYAKELSSSEIVSMMELGMCSIEVDKHESSRVIRWEDLLVQRRSGTITDAYLENCLESVFEETVEKGEKLVSAERKLNETTHELTTTRAEKEKIEEKLSMELEETQRRLNSTRGEKEKMSTNLNSTLTELEKTQRRLNLTLAELEEVTALKNRTWDWEIFLSDQFLNQTFAAEHSHLLHSSWDDIAERLVGIRITDEFLKLSAHIDRDEDRPWSILYSENYFNETFTREMAHRLTSIWEGISEKLVGVTMTKEVIELLDYVTDKSNCGT